MRSMLFVPGDSERKLAKADETSSDALVLDLEDAVDPRRKQIARELIVEFLAHRTRPSRDDAPRRQASTTHSIGGTGHRLPTCWIRINPLDDPESRADLDAVLPARPDGLVLPKPRSAEDVARLGKLLDDLEPRAAIAPGATYILPISTETPSAVFALGGYAGSSPRLAGLTWGAEDLATALGAETALDEDGEWLPTFRLVRSLCLLAAAEAGVPAIDTVYTDFRNEAGLLRQARAAKRDGFVGKLAIHPAQVDVLNDVFTPSRDDVARAQRIVDAFATSSGAGVVSLDGRMLDRPHLVRARRVIALAKRLETASKQGSNKEGGSHVATQ